MTTHHIDPVQRVYGSILAQITFTLGIAAPLFLVAQAVFGVGLISTTEALIMVLAVTVIWYVNRRGGILAPATVIVLIAAMMIAIYDPASYAVVNGYPVVNVAFVVPGLLASLLIGWFWGYPVMLATTLMLGMRAMYAGYSLDAAQHFVVVALSELSVVVSFVAIVSFYFRASLMQAVSTAEQLEQRVLERTAELDEVHRSWQVETAQVTHDLKNLMTITMSEVSLMLEELDDLQHDGSPLDVGGMRGAFQRIADAQRLQAGLVGDLHTLSVLKVNASALVVSSEEYDLAARIRHLTNVMHTYVVSSSIQLYIELPPQLFILADPARIDRVVLNLLANAIKFTGGYRDGDGAITVTLRAEGADALLEVADNGIGISAAGLTRIGERWVRDVRHERMPPGTGLGLNFSTAMVRLFHGTIEVFSPGERQGTMVRVRLPLAPGDSPCPTISTSLRTTAR